MKKKRNRNKNLSSTNPNSNSPLDDAFACKEIVANIVQYLPTKQQIKSCMLVSTTWKDAVNTLPIKNMRIEDRNKNQIWFHQPSCRYIVDDATVHVRFHKTGIIPMSVRERVTKLTVVLRFVEKYKYRYDLDTISNLLVGFSMLEDLTVVETTGCTYKHHFCNIFRHPNSLPSLIKLKFLNFEFKFYDDVLKFVKAAPNIEYLYSNIQLYERHYTHDLLLLLKSLKKIQIACSTGRLWNTYSYIDNNEYIDTFIDQMPCLEAWLFGHPLGNRRHPNEKNAHLLDPIEKNCSLVQEHGFHGDFKGGLVFHDRVLHWYLKLKEEDKNREDTTLMVDAVSTLYGMSDLMTVSNIGNKNLSEKIIEHVHSIPEIKYSWNERIRRRRQAKLEKTHRYNFEESISPLSGAIVWDYQL